MEKALRAHWLLQDKVRKIVEDVAPGLPIIPVVQHDDEQIVWDEECRGLSNAPWTCRYFIPLDHPARALVPVLNAAIAPLQGRYDLGMTCD